MAAEPAAWAVPGAAFEQIFRSAPDALLVIRAEGLVMVDANARYLAQVEMPLDAIAGRNVFEVFPESPENEDTQTGILQRLMTDAIDTRQTTVAERLRYDIPVEGGHFDVRWWNVLETPLLAPDGEVAYLLHRSEDVTDLVRAEGALDAAQEVRSRVARQLASQAELALALTRADSVADVERIVMERVFDLVEASSGAVLTRAENGGWRATVPHGATVPDRLDLADLPYDSPLPSPTAARRSRAVLLPDRAAGLAFHPEVATVYEVFDCEGYAAFPLVTGERRLGALSVSWPDPHLVTSDEQELLQGVAAQCALALGRIEESAARQKTADQLQTLAESLQNAMLPTPPSVPDFELAVRYRSAADVAKVGGDWYDAFIQPDGAVMVTIGDVVGHDHVAAGKMGQISGLLRALAFDAEDAPHGVDPVDTLRRYERVADALGIDELATVVLARIEPDGDGHWVRWSNAGSPPPVLVEPDGRTRLLDDKPDVMLGVGIFDDREEHTVHLAPGATLLLYTDGLIERRDAGIDDGIGELAAAMGEAAGLPVEELCDQVLDRLAPHIGEDDVAMLAIRPLR